MSEVIGVLTAAALFAAFGLLQRRLSPSSGCHSCGHKDDPAFCESCDTGSKHFGVKQ
jgi:hypothetical protein